MSTVSSQPDSLSFLQNLNKFEITPTGDSVTFALYRDDVLLLSEIYYPDSENHVSIDVRLIIEGLLTVAIPLDSAVITDDIFTEITNSYGDFSAIIDEGSAIAFRVLKGGVFELQELTENFVADHFLTWQPQEKYILQSQPELLGIYATIAGDVKLKVYYGDGTNYVNTFCTLEAEKMYLINTSWGVVSSFMFAELATDESKLVIAWDVWFADGSTQVTAIQRYQLRNAGIEEHVFVWENTLGGIDSVSMTGCAEDDQKLTHKTALYDNDTISEYGIDKFREIRQATGYLTEDEGLWLQDFFVSTQKYLVRHDGSLTQIAIVSSKVVTSTLDDTANYEFTYRISTDSKLLNLERTLDTLPTPEGLADFFLTELLSSLTEAFYTGNLIMAVQSPFATGWQKISFNEMFGAALPTLVDGKTVIVIDGKLKAIGGGSSSLIDFEEIKQFIQNYLVYENGPVDTRTELIEGSVLWVSGLTFLATDIIYSLNGNHLVAAGGSYTLDAADLQYGRIDTFYVNAQSRLMVAKGEASPNPAQTVLLANQLLVTTVSIPANSLTPDGVSVEIVYDENTEWATSSTSDTDVTVDFNCVLDPVSESKHIQVLIEIPDSTIEVPTHTIGEYYQGGRIFYLSADGKSGLIAAEDDTAEEVWSRLSGSPVYTTGATGTAIGTGQANTDLMLANDAAGDWIAKLCDDLIVETYTDWYLPSELELSEMCFRKFEIGNFSTKTYWSSTEATWDKARCISFGDRVVHTMRKNNSFFVRAIRSFSDSAIVADVPVQTFSPVATKLIFTHSTAGLPILDGILSFYIKSSLAWLDGSMLIIECFQGSTRCGSVALCPTANMYGYSHGSTDWQMVAINMSRFVPTRLTVDKFRISFLGSWPNNIELGFDLIRYQYSTLFLAEKTKTEIQELLVESPNDVLKIFSTTLPFRPLSTSVKCNGVVCTRGFDYWETDGKIEFLITPETGDVLLCSYYPI